MADTELYQAAIDDFDLEIETLSDTFQKALARYEFPYQDGALLEDMGQKARCCQIKCYFWDDGAGHETYDDHIEFLNHLDSREYFEFVHPKYGPIKGCVETVGVRADDRERMAEVEISFVENWRTDAQIPAAPGDMDVGSEVGGNFLDAVFEAIDTFESDVMGVVQEVQTTVGGVIDGVREVLAAPIVFGEALAAQIPPVTGLAAFLIGAVTNCVTGIGAAEAAVSNPANSVLNAAAFPATLGGLVGFTAAQCCERAMLGHASMTGNPVQYVQAVAADLAALPAMLPPMAGLPAATPLGSTGAGPATWDATALRASVAAAILPKTVKTIAAAQLSAATAAIYETDQAAWEAWKRAEQALSFDVLGNFVGVEAGVAPMTVNDLEQTLYVARSAIQDAIDFARASDSVPGLGASGVSGASPAGGSVGLFSGLKKAAVALERCVSQVKIQRENVIQVRLDNPMPLHLVCLKYNLDYNVAERLWAINSGIVRNPNAASGVINIYASD